MLLLSQKSAFRSCICGKFHFCIRISGEHVDGLDLRSTHSSTLAEELQHEQEPAANSKARRTMSVCGSFALASLLKHGGVLSEAEAAQVCRMLLESLGELHAQSQAHGNVTLDTVTIRIPGHNAILSVHLDDPDMPTVFPGSREAAHRPPAEDGGRDTADDIWSVGVLVLQMMTGTHERGIVDRQTGAMPVLPRGTTLEAIDFLMDCLAPCKKHRSTAAELIQHSFLRSALAPPCGPAPATDEEDCLAESLSDVLLISPEAKQQAHRCRPLAVPALRVATSKHSELFTEPSHTQRCVSCRCKAGKGPCGDQPSAKPAAESPPPTLMRMASSATTRRAKRTAPHDLDPVDGTAACKRLCGSVIEARQLHSAHACRPRLLGCHPQQAAPVAN